VRHLTDSGKIRAKLEFRKSVGVKSFWRCLPQKDYEGMGRIGRLRKENEPAEIKEGMKILGIGKPPGERVGGW
jgi:hypothetical protein